MAVTYDDAIGALVRDGFTRDEADRAWTYSAMLASTGMPSKKAAEEGVKLANRLKRERLRAEIDKQVAELEARQRGPKLSSSIGDALVARETRRKSKR